MANRRNVVYQSAEVLSAVPAVVRPAFCGSFPSVTICAPHIAFRDFSLETGDRRRECDEFCNVCALPTADVIEFEHERIGDAAINACVLLEVFANECTVTRAGGACVPSQRFANDRRLRVVSRIIRICASPTERLQSVTRTAPYVKVSSRFPLSAPPTTLHWVIIPFASANTVAHPWRPARGTTRPAGVEPASFRLEGGCLIR